MVGGGVFFNPFAEVESAHSTDPADSEEKYKTKTDRVGKVIHWELCKRIKFDHTDKYTHQNLFKKMLRPQKKAYEINKINLEKRIKVIHYSKQVIQCCQCNLCYLLPEWITVKCHIFTGRVHCASEIGMIPKIVLSAFGPFIGHHQGLLACVRCVCFLKEFWKFLKVYTITKIWERRVG